MARLRGVPELRQQQGHMAADVRPACPNLPRLLTSPLYQIFVMKRAGELFLWERLLDSVVVDKWDLSHRNYFEVSFCQKPSVLCKAKGLWHFSLQFCSKWALCLFLTTQFAKQYPGNLGTSQLKSSLERQIWGLWKESWPWESDQSLTLTSSENLCKMQNLSRPYFLSSVKWGEYSKSGHDY